MFTVEAGMDDNRGREGNRYVAGGQDSAREEQQVHPMPRVRLSAEELQVLKECNQESFWYRCVPLGVLFIGSTQILVNRGILKPNPRFGALVKNLGAGLLAFVAGKWSYRNVCREKILRLENSALADAMRHGKAGLGEAMRDQAVYETVADDAPKSRRKDPLFVSSADQRGLDDSLRPSLDNGTSAPRPNQSEKNNITYDELRRQNRNTYENKMHSGEGGGSESGRGQQPVVRPPEYRPSSRSNDQQLEANKRNVKRNQFGDEIEV